MVVGFVNSGLMRLEQAVGIIMGANIGTTITSWLLSLSGLESDTAAGSLCKTFSEKIHAIQKKSKAAGHGK